MVNEASSLVLRWCRSVQSRYLEEIGGYLQFGHHGLQFSDTILHGIRWVATIVSSDRQDDGGQRRR